MEYKFKNLSTISEERLEQLKEWLVRNYNGAYKGCLYNDVSVSYRTSNMGSVTFVIKDNKPANSKDNLL